MHPETMKHKAVLWDGEPGTSRRLTEVVWEGDITPEELAQVAEQVDTEWQTIELQLDPAHPRHGEAFRLQKTWPNPDDEAFALRVLEAEDELEGQFVWVHCCKRVEDPEGELVDAFGCIYHQIFNTHMFCVEFESFDAIADLCDQHFGHDGWNAYELYLDDELPEPAASYG